MHGFGMPGPSGFGMMFSIFPIIVFIGFAGIIVTCIIMAVKGTAQWGKNNASPVLTVDATVVAKRGDVSRRTHMHDDHRTHSSTTYYYVTFQVESGDRMELAVTGTEYGMLVEGDEGKLTFQGTRYQGFDRGR